MTIPPSTRSIGSQLAAPTPQQVYQQPRPPRSQPEHYSTAEDFDKERTMFTLQIYTTYQFKDFIKNDLINKKLIHLSCKRDRRKVIGEDTIDNLVIVELQQALEKLDHYFFVEKDVVIRNPITWQNETCRMANPLLRADLYINTATQSKNMALKYYSDIDKDTPRKQGGMFGKNHLMHIEFEKSKTNYPIVTFAAGKQTHLEVLTERISHDPETRIKDFGRFIAIMDEFKTELERTQYGPEK